MLQENTDMCSYWLLCLCYGKGERKWLIEGGCVVHTRIYGKCEPRHVIVSYLWNMEPHMYETGASSCASYAQNVEHQDVIYQGIPEVSLV